MTKKDRDQVREDPGDDSVLFRIHLHWRGSTPEVLSSPDNTEAVGHIWRDKEGAWQLAFAVQRGNGRRQRHFVTIDPDGIRNDRWALQKLGPGVWDIGQSIFFAGQIHAFVTLIGVPDPAPWEK